MSEVDYQESNIVSIEQAILGAVLRGGVITWDIIADKINPSLFCQATHKDIFIAMKSLAAKLTEIDIITVETELAYKESILDYLFSLADNSFSTSNILTYCNLLLEHGTKTKIKETGIGIAMLADENLFPSEMIDKAESMIFQIQTNSVRGGGPKPISDVMQQFFDSIDKNIEPTSTGFVELDRMMDGGMRPGELIVIAGRPGMGKTTLGMNIAQHVATELNKGVLVFSMEMSAIGILERLFASMGGINQSAIRKKKISDRDFIRISEAMEKLSKNHLRIDETGQIKPSELRARARRDKREYKDLGLIVVDYLQLMNSDTRYDNRNNQIGECSGALKALAKELEIPIIALAQLNRMSANRASDNKRPTMSELRESGSIEQDSDLVALIYRDEIYNKDSPDKGLAEIIIDKQRNGETGTFKLLFRPENNQFLNYRDFHL